MAYLVQITRLDSLVMVLSCFQETPKCKGCGEAGPLSLDLSSPIHERACVNKGPSQCMGWGGISSFSPPYPGSGPSSMSLG